MRDKELAEFRMIAKTNLDRMSPDDMRKMAHQFRGLASALVDEVVKLRAFLDAHPCGTLDTDCLGCGNDINQPHRDDCELVALLERTPLK